MGDAGIPREFPERAAAIMTAAVAVKDEFRIPGSRSQYLAEGLIHKVPAKMIQQVPLDYSGVSIGRSQLRGGASPERA